MIVEKLPPGVTKIGAVIKRGDGDVGTGTRGRRTWGLGDAERENSGTLGREDLGTRGRGDVGTWGRGDVERRD